MDKFLKKLVLIVEGFWSIHISSKWYISHKAWKEGTYFFLDNLNYPMYQEFINVVNVS